MYAKCGKFMLLYKMQNPNPTSSTKLGVSHAFSIFLFLTITC